MHDHRFVSGIDLGGSLITLGEIGESGRLFESLESLWRALPAHSVTRDAGLFVNAFSIRGIGFERITKILRMRAGRGNSTEEDWQNHFRHASLSHRASLSVSVLR